MALQIFPDFGIALVLLCLRLFEGSDHELIPAELVADIIQRPVIIVERDEGQVIKQEINVPFHASFEVVSILWESDLAQPITESSDYGGVDDG